ncbi:VanW family protein [Candidatus Microgenomates bacterium]|nr:VanW family protein [Candidatus Microgenomates bacterium]
MDNFISTLALLGLSLLTPADQATVAGVLNVAPEEFKSEEKVLAQKTLDLSTRHPVKSVNEVFADNILLNLHYLKGDSEELKDKNGKIDWEKVRAPFEFTMTLKPEQTFAYHKNLHSEFKDKDVIAGKSGFGFSDGYKSDGYLVGDGVCHLASLFNWVASEAGLTVKSMVNHDFLPVPEVPREYGTSVFYSPDGSRNSANQNLYITNTFPYPVTFEISSDGKWVEIQVVTETE